MSRINTNVASLRGLRSLQRANSLLDTSLTRLSTGLKINSGKDNPSGLIASETLRLQVTSIEQSIRNSNRANNVIGTADAALGEITGLLNQIRGLVQEGLNSGALSTEEIEANQAQIDSALSAINRTSANTTFAGDKLIDGSKAFTTQVSSADAAELSDYAINEALFGSSSTIEVAASVTQTAQKGELIYRDGALSAAATLEISGSKGNQVIFLGSSASLTNIKDAVNNVKDVTGVEVANTAGATLDSTAADADINVSDIRAAGTPGTVSIELVEASSDSGLSVSTSTTGNDTKITVELADTAGTITSTADDVIAALNGDATVKTLIFAEETNGDGTGVVDAIAETDLTGTAGNVLRLSSTEYGAKHFVDVNVLDGTFDTYDVGGDTASNRDAGRDIGVTINGQTATTDGLEARVRTNSLDASITIAEASNSTSTTATVTVTGGGSLFQIGQEVSPAGQVGLGIEAVNTARLGGVTGKLYELGSGGGKSLLDIGPSVSGSDLVKIIDEALDRVTTLRGRLGSLQKNVIDTNITTLGVALENITEARSQIVDTDFATQTAELTRAQILSQSTLSVLAIANQNPAQVLSLLG